MATFRRSEIGQDGGESNKISLALTALLLPQSLSHRRTSVDPSLEHYPSSLTEAFCIAILEAASCGLLTVSTCVGGVPEVLSDDMVVLAKPDPIDMVQAIQKAISMLPKIDSQDMHLRLSEFSKYMWFVLRCAACSIVLMFCLFHKSLTVSASVPLHLLAAGLSIMCWQCLSVMCLSAVI